MEVTHPLLNKYSETHTTAESQLLNRINRETYAGVHMPRMLSGHLQGRFLAMISRMIRPHSILEIGTYTGYSAICLAEGLKHDGTLITIDNNEELGARVRGYFQEAGLTNVIVYQLGDAAAVIPLLPGPFDLVWLDADKENYSHYFDLVIDKIPSGGFMLADNVLWSGKVLDSNPDKDSRAIQEFNKKVMNDPRVESVLLPLRDGIMMLAKI